MRALGELRLLAAASVRMDSGVSVVALDTSTAARALGPLVGDLVRLRVSLAAVVVGGVACAMTAGIVAGKRWGLALALVFLLALVMNLLEGVPRGRRMGSVAAWIAWLGAAAASTFGLLGGLLALATVLPLPSQSATVIAVALAALVSSGFVLWMFRGFRVGVALAVYVGTVVFLVADSGAGRALALGAVVGFVSVVVICFCGLEQEWSDRADRFRSSSWIQLTLSMLALLAVPLMVGTSPPVPPFPWLSGLLIGGLLGLVPGVFFAILMSGVVVRAGLAIAGEPNPWRRSFLRFAADRGLLVRAGSEYRFVHPLIRDHLADCDPVVLGAAVGRRRAELQA